MNKLWCFGDSFTYGHGCRPGYEYYDKYPDNRGLLWTEVIANTLKLKQKNLGIPGNSNPNITNQVLKNLTKIKKKDVVILSDTLPYRTLLFDSHTDQIAPITTDILILPENSNLENDFFNQRYFKTNKEKEVFLDYIYSFKLPYENKWREYYEKQLMYIQTHLLSLGIETYFWSHKRWDYPSPFETIFKATEKEVGDGHWSWKGHQDFSNYLLQRIQKQEYLHNPVLI